MALKDALEELKELVKTEELDVLEDIREEVAELIGEEAEEEAGVLPILARTSLSTFSHSAIMALTFSTQTACVLSGLTLSMTSDEKLSNFILIADTAGFALKRGATWPTWVRKSWYAFDETKDSTWGHWFL